MQNTASATAPGPVAGPPPRNPWPLSIDAALAGVEAQMAKLLAGTLAGSVLPPMAQSCLASGGKRVRARLALAACEALGVDVAAAQVWATSCELMHNATLVHDDLQDGDTTRRGKPTLWVSHGAAQAINVGDWLFMQAFANLRALPQARAARVGFVLGQTLADGMAQVIEGQGLECASQAYFGRVPSFPYEAMVRGKTAALFALPVLGAALLADQGEAEARVLAEPFGELGVLFQMQDDVLDLWGDKGRGAPGADLLEGKLSAVVVTHLRRAPQDAPWLEALLLRPRAETTPQQVQEAIATFASSGTRAEVLAEMQRRTDQTRRACTGALGPVMAELLQRTWAPLATLLANVAKAP